MPNILKLFLVLVVMGLGFPSAAKADAEHVGPAKALAKNKIAKWAMDPSVIAAINEQNAANADLDQGAIDSLDKQWRAETGASAKPLIDSVLAKPLSSYLKGIKESSNGLYTEIFVMDNKGLNVGQSDVTSDYWQGDEAKWKQTFGAGAGAVHVSEIEEDESTETFQTQVSVAISDPASGQVIGAVTVGVNVETMLE